MGLVIHYDYLTKTNIKTYISNKILSKGIVYCLLPQHIEHDHHCPDTSVSFLLTCCCACSSVSMETGRTGSTDEACRDVGALKALNPRVTRPTRARRRAGGFGPQRNLRYSCWCGRCCFDWRQNNKDENKNKKNIFIIM